MSQIDLDHSIGVRGFLCVGGFWMDYQGVQGLSLKLTEN